DPRPTTDRGLPMNRSQRAHTLLVVTGATLIFLTTIVVLTARGILDPDQFARRLARSLGDGRVAGYVAGQVTDGIVAARPDLISVRPILESSVRAVVGSEPFRAVVRTSARSAHYSLFESKGQRVVLALPDISVLVRSALRQASPELAAKLPPAVETALSSESAQRAFTLFINFWRMGQQLVLACWLLWYLGILLVLAGLWFAPTGGGAWSSPAARSRRWPSAFSRCRLPAGSWPTPSATSRRCAARSPGSGWRTSPTSAGWR
ncbi:MAG: hypothetical protein OEW17_05930, partial [Gemmatimonadota bacterium]|nr:hypothetical protein [Gemmatimonadota bacterium]